MKAKYVIIGNSAGAIGGVEGIRALDKEGDIIIVSSETLYPIFCAEKPICRA